MEEITSLSAEKIYYLIYKNVKNICAKITSEYCDFKIFLDKYIYICVEKLMQIFIHIHLKLVKNVFPCFVKKKKNYLSYALEISH